MTQGQRRALEELAPRYLVDPEPNQWAEVFGRRAPLGVEIGFGMGQATLDWAAGEPGLNLVGIEIYRPGIGALLAGIERLGLANLRLLEGDAALLLDSKFEAGSLEEARILFPDPWPKKRHHKRRLIQPAFVRLLASRAAPRRTAAAGHGFGGVRGVDGGCAGGGAGACGGSARANGQPPALKPAASAWATAFHDLAYQRKN